MLLSLIRSLAALLLGLAVFAGILLGLVLHQLSGKLFDPAVYANALAAADAYPRLYADLPAGADKESWARDTRGNGLPVADADLVDLMREMTPLLPLLAAARGYPTVADLQRDLPRLRKDLDQFLNRGRLVSLALVILGTALLGLLYLPDLACCLRWPGVTLLLSGLAAFLLGWLAMAVLPGAAAEGVRRLAAAEGELSPELGNLLAVVTQELATGLLAGVGNGGLALALLGAVLLALAYILDRRREKWPVLRVKAGSAGGI